MLSCSESLHYSSSQTENVPKVVEKGIFLSLTAVLHYHDVCHHARPVVFQQTWVPNSLLMGAN